MDNLNKVYLIGKLGRDPETKYMVNGQPVTKMSVATSTKWKDKTSGDWKEDTEWHRVVCFGYQANYAQKYGYKGADVFIEGKLKTSSYEKDGVKQYSTDIIAESVKFFAKKTESYGQQEPNVPSDGWAAPGQGFKPNDDGIPF